MLLQAEEEVSALTRRIALLEVDFQQTASRLETASGQLEEASKHAEESEKYVTYKHKAGLQYYKSILTVICNLIIIFIIMGGNCI